MRDHERKTKTLWRMTECQETLEPKENDQEIPEENAAQI